MVISAIWLFAQTPGPLILEPVIEKVPPVYMGVIPFLPPDKLREQISPVYSYLEKKLGRPVLLTTVSDYESLARLLELKKVHIAWFSHASFEKLRGERRWQVVCRPMQNGSVIYSGQIIVKRESPFNSLEDLQGKTFAYVDRFSGSGFYFPNLLFSELKIRPLDFFNRVCFTGSHRNSIVGVLDGTYQAAAVFSAGLVEKSDENLRVLARTGPIPNDPFVVREDLEAGLKKRIEEAMLGMHEDPEGIAHIGILKKLRGTEKFVSEAEVQAIIAAGKK